MDQRRINHGSTWINVDQASSACRLQHVAAVAHASWLMRHGSWLMRSALSPFSVHASDSCVMCHASGVRLMAHASCVPLTWHASNASGVRRQAHGSCVLTHGSCVRRQASDSWLMRPDSWLMRPDSWLMRHASCVMRHASNASGVRRQTPRAPIQPIQLIQPPPVVGHDDNKAAAFSHATPLRFAPIALYGMG